MSDSNIGGAPAGGEGKGGERWTEGKGDQLDLLTTSIRASCGDLVVMQRDGGVGRWSSGGRRGHKGEVRHTEGSGTSSAKYSDIYDKIHRNCRMGKRNGHHRRKGLQCGGARLIGKARFLKQWPAPLHSPNPFILLLELLRLPLLLQFLVLLLFLLTLLDMSSSLE